MVLVDGGAELMQVFGLNCSPNTDGLTATMLEAALEGAKEAGAFAVPCALRRLRIEACRACGTSHDGLCHTECRCAIEDDFRMVREAMVGADALVVATPVYYGEVAEVVKAFFDRLRRCQDGTGRPENRSNLAKPVIGIAAAGGAGGGSSSALAMLENYLRQVGLKPFDLITATQANRHYKLAACESAGAEMVRSLG